MRVDEPPWEPNQIHAHVPANQPTDRLIHPPINHTKHQPCTTYPSSWSAARRPHVIKSSREEQPTPTHHPPTSLRVPALTDLPVHCRQPAAGAEISVFGPVHVQKNTASEGSRTEEGG